MPKVQEIVNKFREVYKDLYNSADTTDAVNLIKNRLEDMIDLDSLDEVNKVTGSVVKKAALKMKPNKSDVTGSYTSDLLINAPDVDATHCIPYAFSSPPQSLHQVLPEFSV